ncbi:hypothetical protein C8R46DRAFT_1001426 [Mycena filopes]|nr:hypothetical protein C8R46DRAFT_1001426 [Mycena filopes]
MLPESVLPVYREKRLGFNPKLQRSSGPLPWTDRLQDTALGRGVRHLWRSCTTTPDGSLSDAFKLSGNDDTDAHTSASGGSKFFPKGGQNDSFLDVVVVDHDEHPEKVPLARAQADSSVRSGPGSTGFGTHTAEFFGVDDLSNHYQGGVISWIRNRGWPHVVNFFEPRFMEHEDDYQTQIWHARKSLTFYASLFLILNWVLYLILNNDSTKHSLYAKIVFWGGFTLFTLPVPLMVALDMPRRSEVLFQIWFCIAVWYCAFAEVIQTRQCHFFTQNHCFGKTFLSTSYYFTGLPALMMFIVSKRLYNCIAQVACFILLVTLIIPVQAIYARNVISFAVFSIFIQGLQYSSESDRRRLYLLAMQLQQASKAKHKARLAESKASFTKRRFANYIFHEVRVPLNTALIALQLLQSGNALKEEFMSGTEIYALELGLKMMKTVLNDVLDFEKMDSGHFETVAKPFPLHRSLRTILDQVEVQAKSRQIVLERSLDDRIDTLPGSLASAEGLWVVGSELRLQQVLTNLAANAVKYTPEATGTVRISTEFLGITTREELPGTPPDIGDGSDASTSSDGHRSPPPLVSKTSATQTQCLNLRLVVHDSGPGIKTSDLVEDRLFQPFAQTILGRASGSGTGLGLALVKNIARLGGWRLGVTSRRGEGSKFWVEISYPIASAAEIEAVRESNNLTAPPEPRSRVQFMTPTPQMDDPPPIAAITIPALPALEPLPAEAQSPTDPLIVLVVDDDALTRLLSSKLLTKLGCVVHTAKDGQECVDMVLGKPPHAYDMICLDNFMPVMTGEAAIQEIRAHDRVDFVVGCTGNALTEDQESYREAGVDAVMVKPMLIHDFRRMIQLAHHRRQERRTKVP